MSLLPGKQVTIVTTAYSTIAPQKTTYLCPLWLAEDAMQNLVADGGGGKGYLAADWSARITNPALGWHDGTPNTQPPGTVFWLEAEDVNAGIVAGRLEQQKANREKVKRLTTKSAEERLNLREHLKQIGETISAYADRRLLVISPLNSYLPPGVNTDKDAEMRHVLDPLTDFAAQYHITILNLLHPGKNTGHRAQHKALSSVAYINVPRITLAAVAKSAFVKGQATEGRVGGIKTNDGILAPTLKFTIDDTGLHWHGPTGEDMRQVFQRGRIGPAGPAIGRPPEKKDAAKAFLFEMLVYGPRYKEQVKAVAAAKGHSASTLDRAVKELGIIEETVPGAKAPTWRLPPALPDAIAGEKA